jgi:hypothetical protein
MVVLILVSISLLVDPATSMLLLSGEIRCGECLEGLTTFLAAVDGTATVISRALLVEAVPAGTAGV